MGFAAAFQAFNTILSLFGIGLGATQIELQRRMQQLHQQMRAQLQKNQQLLDDAKKFQEHVEVISSNHLNTQQGTVSVLLQSTLRNIESYYNYLAQIMIGVDRTYFKSVMESLPGSTASDKILNYVSNSLFGLEIAFALFSIRQCYKKYKAWDSYTVTDPLRKSYLGILMDDAQSFFSKGLKKCYDVGKVCKNPVSQVSISKAMSTIKKNAGSFKDFAVNITKSHKLNFKTAKRTIKNVISSVGFVGSIASIGFSIFSIIGSLQAQEQLKAKVAQLKTKLDQFFESCLETLYHVEQFLLGLQSQLYCYAAYISYIKLISFHNLLSNVQDPQQFATKISLLQLQQLDTNIFIQVQKSKVKLAQVVAGMQITKTLKPDQEGVADEDKKYSYQTTESFEAITQRFSAMTTVIADLDNQIKIADIYNQFYLKFQLAHAILQSVDFEKVERWGKVVRNIKNSVQKLHTIQKIQSYYQIQFNIDLASDKDKYQIAQIISLFTDYFPKNTQNTTVYGIELSSFASIQDSGSEVDSTTQIYDLDMTEIMGDWPEQKKQRSINEIVAAASVAKEDLLYKSSSIYIQNVGTLTQVDYQLWRVQVFEIEVGEQITKYYALYDGVSNVFEKVKIRDMLSK